jgi:hypothetical protein
VLATSDGGARWTALPEPCPLIGSVHFVSRIGFAVAGGRDVGDFGPGWDPEAAGMALGTSDGGRNWRVRPSPADAQTICLAIGAMAGWARTDGCTGPPPGPQLGAGHRHGHPDLGRYQRTPESFRTSASCPPSPK